jgi:hypothetical protein
VTAADLTGDGDYSDEDLDRIVTRMERSVVAAQQGVRGALLDLARIATEDADAVVTVPPEAWQPQFVVKQRKVERMMLGLDSARADLTAWAKERDKRLAKRDLASSASRQHYIDTGNYLAPGEAVDA